MQVTRGGSGPEQRPQDTSETVLTGDEKFCKNFCCFRFKVASTQVMTRDGRSRGFGFVIFSELPRADLLASSGNLTVRGRPISVKPSIPQEEMQELPPPEKRTKKLFIGVLV